MIGGYAPFSNTKRLKKLPFFAFFYRNRGFLMLFYEFCKFDRSTNREVYRYRGTFWLHWMWLKAFAMRDKSARFGYRAWLYWQVAHEGSLVTKDMLTWQDEIM
ncbi:hypothetical protein [Bifidobacterium pseudocatenulatum]|uniref:hypothetical protein n=1 Tax=Bifidobacterium pseudocatenulatum TaxID=28026 RepID=UPI0034A5119A